jgi:hypothetical protein
VPRPQGHPRSVTPGHVALRAVAEIVDIVEAPSLESLHRLADRTVWTEKYLTLRYRWRPQDRPLVLVLRVAALPDAVEVEERVEYGGCRSWLELQDAPDASQAQPLWSEQRLQQECAAVRDALGAPTPA